MTKRGFRNIETKKIVVYAHCRGYEEHPIEQAKELGAVMQSWAVEQRMIPVAAMIEVCDEVNGIMRPGLSRCYSMIRESEADAVLVLCRRAIADNDEDVMDFLMSVVEGDGEVISIRNDLPYESGPHRFDINKLNSKCISYARLYNLI